MRRQELPMLGLVALMLVSLAGGIWVGTVSIMNHTYQQCSTAGEVRYENVFLVKPLSIKCSAPKESS